MSNCEPMDILLIEDNPGDIRLLEKALTKMTIKYNLEVITDGEEAIDYLQDKAAKSDPVISPDFIILDLNLPRQSGGDVLQTIKNHPKLLHIPVMILTSSESQKDILACYQAHANSYVVKPMNINEFFSITQSIENFWFKSNQSPTSTWKLGGGN